MKTLSLTHLLFILISLVVTILLCFITRKVSRKWQNLIFAIIVAIGCFGIFFRHAMGLTFSGKIKITNLLLQQLQVCNFNFILLPLMLIPNNELASQYSCMFSMFAAFTTFLSIPSRFAILHWYDVSILNFWLNHYCAILLPVLMIASRRLKPQKKYIFPVVACVFLYFTTSYLIQLILINNNIITLETSLSYVMKTDKIFVFDLLYKIIPFHYFYLYPFIPILAIFFWGLSKIFEKYETIKY